MWNFYNAAMAGVVNTYLSALGCLRVCVCVCIYLIDPFGFTVYRFHKEFIYLFICFSFSLFDSALRLIPFLMMACLESKETMLHVQRDPGNAWSRGNALRLPSLITAINYRKENNQASFLPHEPSNPSFWSDSSSCRALKPTHHADFLPLVRL